MTVEKINQLLQQVTDGVGETLSQGETYSQLLFVIIRLPGCIFPGAPNSPFPANFRAAQR